LSELPGTLALWFRNASNQIKAGDIMKVLDVDLLQDGLTRNINRMNQLEKEITAIQKAVEELTAMEDALKGEGGQAIRDFYTSCHLPFLQYFLTFKEEFNAVLQQAQQALTSLEPVDDGHIVEEFLETEVEEGLKASADITTALTDEANAIMDEVSDIVSLPKLDDTLVHESIADAKTKRNDTVEALHTFDSTQTNQLVPIESSIQSMKEWVQNIEGLYKEGLTDVNFPTDKWSSIAGNSAIVMSLSAMGMETGIDSQEMLACERPVETDVKEDRAWYQVVGDAVVGFFEGAGKAIADIFTGLYDTLKAMFTDPKAFFGGLATAILNPIDTATMMWNALETAWERDVINGDARSRAAFFSYGAVSVFGLKGLDKIGKAGKLGTAASKADNSLPYNAMKTDALKNTLKTNVHAVINEKTKQAADLWKSNFSKEAINNTIQAVKNAEVITNARNVLNPVKVKTMTREVYDDYVKTPLQKGYTYAKGYVKKIGDFKTPLAYQVATPFGNMWVQKTVSEVAHDMKESAVHMSKKLDETISGDKKNKVDSDTFEAAMIEAARNQPPYSRKPNKPRNFINKIRNEDGTTTYTFLSVKNGKEYNVTYDKGGFPIFSSKFEALLPEKYYLETDAVQFEYLSKLIYKEILKDTSLERTFTKKEIEVLKTGRVPTTLTWHHHQETGKMQMVDYFEHQVASHTGGRAIWGGGEAGRKGKIKKSILEMISWQ
jgi:predicted ribonuclease toxin of YeeF-YezG toxin-antitoxin module